MEQIQKSPNHKRLFFIALVPMALLLNQSNVVLGINISLSDFFLLLLICILPLVKDIRLPFPFFIFGLVLTCSLIFTSFVLNEIHFGISASPGYFFRDYIKLLTVFLYFIVGYNLSTMGLFKDIVKWFSIGSLILGILSIIYTLISPPFLQELLYFGGNRFRGLMNDPNYFSVIQSTAIMYFLSNSNIRRKYRILALLILCFSIITSGSKTGIILLIFMCMYKLTQYFFSKKKNKQKVLIMLIGIVTFSLLILLTYFYFTSILSNLTKVIPGFERVSELFTNFDEAISSSGSKRDMAWGNASQLIKFSPFLGIGIGTYSNLASYLFGNSTIAHNTYLQLAVEWGSIMMIIFMCTIFYLMVKITLYANKGYTVNGKVVRDMLIPILVGSFSLSLNNARIFWLLLGTLAYFAKKNLNSKSKDF